MKRLKKQAKLFSKLLDIPEDTSINIKLKNIKSGYSGETIQLGELFYRVLINKNLCKHQQAKVLAHELVHVRQYIGGDLIDLPGKDGLYKWKGDLIKIEEGSMDDYFLSPWELEARALEDWLVYRWEVR